MTSAKSYLQGPLVLDRLSFSNRLQQNRPTQNVSCHAAYTIGQFSKIQIHSNPNRLVSLSYYSKENNPPPPTSHPLTPLASPPRTPLPVTPSCCCFFYCCCTMCLLCLGSITLQRQALLPCPGEHLSVSYVGGLGIHL